MNTLVYINSKDLAPIGGPRGYNYNLKSELDKMKASNIKYICANTENINVKVKDFVDNIKIKCLKEVLKTLKSIANRMNIIYGKSKEPVTKLNDYDCVHFHNSLEMYRIRKALNLYRGKVILTSHSPSLCSEELIDTASSFEKKYFKKFYRRLEKVDKYAFNRADYIIFPCKEAEEPYYHGWNYYKSFRESKKNRYRYLLTGIPPASAKKTKEEIKKIYNIPDDAFIISYVGRHNEIKGYDSLKEIAKVILDKYTNVYVLVAGKEGPLYRLINNRWIEVGWTKDPHSIIAASDVFILPNKETYFDLILLEVISLGVVALISKTGGNRFFEGKTDGILLYNGNEEAIKLLIEIMNEDDYIRFNRKKANLELFNSMFTCQVFAQNYIKILEEISGEVSNGI